MYTGSHSLSSIEGQSASNFPFYVLNYQYPPLQWIICIRSNMLIVSSILKITNPPKSLLISHSLLGAAWSLIFLLSFSLKPVPTRFSSPPLQTNSSYKSYQSCVHCLIQWSFVFNFLVPSINDFLHNHPSFLKPFLHLASGHHSLLIFFLLHVSFPSASLLANYWNWGGGLWEPLTLWPSWTKVW